MAEKYTGNLVQTNGYFKIKGIISNKDKETARKGYGYIEGTSKSDGNPYKSIRFMVKTSPENIISVEKFGSVQKEAYAYNKDKKETKKIEWAKRGGKLPEGFNLITPDYDFVAQMNGEFSDGDSVVVIGEFDINSYVDKNGVTQYTRKQIIKRMYKEDKAIDFNAENFEEVNEFQQEIVVIAIAEEPKFNKVYINGYVIGYGGKFNPIQMEIDTTAVNPNFVKNIKALKFGDFIKFNGTIENRATSEEVDGEWGKQVTKGFKKCLNVFGADGSTLIKKRYKEQDFVSVTPSPANVQATLDAIENAVNAESEEELPFSLDD